MTGDASLGAIPFLGALSETRLPSLDDGPDATDLLEEALELVRADPIPDWAWQRWAEKAERFMNLDRMRRMEASE